MLYTPPKSRYCGLSLVLENPSRFDLKAKALLLGYARKLVEKALLVYSIENCEIRLAADQRDWLPGTKIVLLLGKNSIKSYTELSLDEIRGTPIYHDAVRNIWFLASYFPQDACDVVDFEARFNPTDAAFGEGDEDRKRKDSDRETKSHGKTMRNNYRFWLRKDIQKAVRWLKEGKPREALPIRVSLYPCINEVCGWLDALTDTSLYLDIETIPSSEEFDTSCIGLGDSKGNIYVVPLRYYDEQVLDIELFALFWKSLNKAMQRNTVIGHNLNFDLFILCYRYKLLLPRKCYDTMFATQRVNARAEKSLGHCGSLWTDLPFHKNSGVFDPKTAEQEQKLFSYNAADIALTREVHLAIETYVAKHPEFRSSIALANDCLYPYLLATLQGVGFASNEVLPAVEMLDRRLTQILRIIQTLVGYEINPNSHQQLSQYFYGVPPVGIGLKKPKEDPTNEKTLRRIYLSNPVPTILALLEFRSLAMESRKLQSLLKRRWKGLYHRETV